MFKRVFDSLKFHINGKINPIKYAKQQGVKIGERCRFIGLPNLGSEPYLIHIGNHVEVSNDVQFVTHDGGTWIFKDIPEYEYPVMTFKEIHIGNNVFIGARSIILGGVTIGNNCVIGAGSIVTHDIPDDSVACGSPAHVLKSTDDYYRKLRSNEPEYDETAYKKDKRAEVTRMCRKHNDKAK